MKNVNKKKSKRQAKPIEQIPKQVIKEPVQPSAFQRVKERISRLWKKRQQEIERMKQSQQKQKTTSVGKEKTDEQLIFEEVSKKNEKKE